MTREQIITRLVDALDSVGTSYMLTGSVAAAYYGTARCTLDVDVVVEPDAGATAGLLAPIGQTSLPGTDVEATECGGSDRHVIRLADGAGAVNVFPLTYDPHDQARFARRRETRFLGRRASLIAAEDLVVTKLRWMQAAARPNDSCDARVLIGLHRYQIDWPYIREWCERHGSLAILEDLLRELPEV